MTKVKLLTRIIPLLLCFQVILEAKASQINMLHQEGYGPVRIGMTVEQASRAIGSKLLPANPLDEDTLHCHYVYAGGNFGPLGYMVEDDVITRIDIREGSPVQTNSGIRIGDSKQKVIKAYSGKITVQRHFYLGKDGSYLKIKHPSGIETLFETDRGKVTTFRVGRLSSVEYVEGCE